MILIIGLDFKDLNQNSYKDAINNIKSDLKSSSLSLFGIEESIIFYGTYLRTFVSDEYPCKFPLRIQRIFCVNTHTTHALIPACLVPHSTIPLKIQLEVIDAIEEELPLIANRCCLDVKRLFHIRDLFDSSWASLIDWLSYSIDNLIIMAIQLKHKQFLQIQGNSFLYIPT